MPRRNRLRDNDNPLEPESPAAATNTTTVRQIQRVMPKGPPLYEPVSVRESRPDGQGGYVDTELTAVVYDVAGNPRPDDNPEGVIYSHSGLFIGSPEERAVCSSALHRGPNRNILIGQDGGQLRNERWICSNCLARRNTLLLGLVCLGLAIVAGIYKALGWF